MLITKKLIIYGHVQGVFFRASTCREAAKNNITGWVRNRRDGSLEAMLHGESESVELLINWARHGPAQARVDRIEISDGFGEYKEFMPLPTT